MAEGQADQSADTKTWCDIRPGSDGHGLLQPCMVQSAHHSFDLIAGTSVGGIIGLGLSAGRSADEIKQSFLDDGDKIFSSRRPASNFLSTGALPVGPFKVALRSHAAPQLCRADRRRRHPHVGSKAADSHPGCEPYRISVSSSLL